MLSRAASCRMATCGTGGAVRWGRVLRAYRTIHFISCCSFYQLSNSKPEVAVTQTTSGFGLATPVDIKNGPVMSRPGF